MALIKCPECGKEISDKATTCPNCGYPIQPENNTKREEIENSFVRVEDVPITVDVSPKPKKKINKSIIALIAALACVCLAAFGFITYQQTKEAENLISDMQGNWYRPYESVARTLEISSDEIVVSAETGFDSVNSQADVYHLNLEGKDGTTFSASSSTDNYKEYTVTFNDDKTKMTIFPALLIDGESEIWYYGKPCFNLDGVITQYTEDCYLDDKTGMMVYLQKVSIGGGEVKIFGNVINTTREDCSYLDGRLALCNADGDEIDVVWPMLYNNDEPLKGGDSYEFYCDENLSEGIAKDVSSYTFDFFEVEMGNKPENEL